MGRTFLRLLKLLLRLGALAVGLGLLAVLVGELTARLRATGAALGIPLPEPPREPAAGAPSEEDEEDRVLRALADSSLFLQEVGAVHQRLREEEYGSEPEVESDKD